MIEVSGLVKTYGGQTVVNDLSFTIPQGTTFGFLGENGAGKTTTIKMLVGLAKPDSGTIRVGGISSLKRSMREHIGFMPEAPYFYDRLTGLEFLQFCDRLSSHASAQAPQRPLSHYEEVLKSVGIYEARHKAIRAYSKGMKQRLGFAQAIVHDPDYIFLDEPLDGLDPIGRKEIKEIIKGLHAKGKTVFFNSHILYDTEQLCDQIGIIHAGTLLYCGPVAQFCQGKPLEEQYISLLESLPRT